MRSQVEQYQQLEQQYAQAHRDYEQAERQYQAAAAANPSDPDLQGRYQELRDKKAALERLYTELTSLRRALAEATEVGSRQAAL